MQTTTFSKGNVAPDEARTLSADFGYSLNVALVFQDDLTRQWAGQTRHLLADLAGEGAVHSSEWNLGELRRPGVFNQGAAALARADAIVLAIYEGRRLPAEFYLWVNLWLQQRNGLPGALIALVGTTGDSGTGAMETRSYLHAVASQAHLELLFKRYPPSGEPAKDLAADLTQWAQAA
jgi:hypothetical protein